MAEAPAHPNALEMASKLNIDTLTNSMVCKNLGLSSIGERHLDIFLTEVLERYYGVYSQSAKVYMTRDIPDPFFRDIAKFLLEVGCVHLNIYGMPKQKAGMFISTFEAKDINWGVVTSTTLQEGLHAFQSGKKLWPIIQQYFTILFPPCTGRRRLEEITTSTWEEDSSSHPAASPPRGRSPSQQEAEEQPTSPYQKRRQIDRKNGKVLAKDSSGPIMTQIFESRPREELGFTSDIVHRKGTLIPNNVVMAYPEIPN